ncbi:MATE family efflux transporter [Taibaiella koreensis]|uniref:MATE family efflux transporter n=1 Tax=Taibaiella koreensis TaxID=1268548 RepID=UPI000E59A2C0|nr:MATE family efflux transporter [Taibaiella koreensis]
MLLRIQYFFNLLVLALKGSEKDFTSGSVNRATFLLAVPTMLELSLESLFVLVDLLYVSRLGEQAITVVGITNSVVILLQSLATGLGIAATALVARRIGERKPKAAGLAAVQVIYLGLLTGGICGMATCLANRQILQLAGASVQLAQYGDLFSKIMFATVPLIILRILLNSIFRGAGNAAIAMRTLMLSNSVNIVLGWLFIFGPGPVPAMGITGAGLAVLVANVAGVLFQLACFAGNKKRFLIERRHFVPELRTLKQLAKLALAGMVQYLVPSSSRFFMIMIVARLGEEVLAGYIIANRIIMFTVLPAWGIANAAGVLTGQNLGARQPQRATASVWRTGLFNMCFLSLMALVLSLCAPQIVSVFTSHQATAGYARIYLYYMSVAYLFFGYTMVISRALNAAGAVNTITLLHVLMFYVIQLPLAYGLAITAGWGARGIFTAIMISEMVLATTCILVFRKGKWQQRHI